MEERPPFRKKKKETKQPDTPNEGRDRGGNDKGENDESGTTARWHEGCSEKRRETAKRDRDSLV